MVKIDQHERATLTLYLEGVPFPLLVSHKVFKNKDVREGSLILASSDTDINASSLLTIYQKRWKVENDGKLRTMESRSKVTWL